MTVKESILIAAKEEFMANGFEAARMRSIAEKAEVNKGLLHYYFKTKEALINEVFQAMFLELFKNLNEVFKSERDIFSKIKIGVGVYIEFISTQKNLPLFIINEMKRDPEKHVARMKQIGTPSPFQELAKSISEAQQQGIINQSIAPKQFVLNMISLVLFPIIAKPMIQFTHSLSDEEYELMILKRKEEVANFLINAIKA